VAKYAAEFEQETGIAVQVDFVGWAEIHDKTVTTLASGGGAMTSSSSRPPMQSNLLSGGWFEPIDDLIPEGDAASGWNR
jgi:ABC-type glycerol-3-phosphate transport system substrate-binding protein